ncbi:hypothetical protein LXL04_006937 [Taraxacum kok-saghyz]
MLTTLQKRMKVIDPWLLVSVDLAIRVIVSCIRVRHEFTRHEFASTAEVEVEPLTVSSLKMLTSSIAGIEFTPILFNVLCSLLSSVVVLCTAFFFLQPNNKHKFDQIKVSIKKEDEEPVVEASVSRNPNQILNQIKEAKKKNRNRDLNKKSQLTRVSDGGGLGVGSEVKTEEV